jgi:hypothetical protein
LRKREKKMSYLGSVLFSVWISLAGVAPAFAAEELKQLLKKLMTVPTVQTASGFTAKVFVPPGSLYDPFDLHAHGNALWVSDDGKEEGEKGGQLFRVDAKGKVSVAIGLGKLLPPIALDVAPPSFGAFTGQIFTVAFARPDAEAGFLVPNVIQRINLTTGEVSNVCTLPKNAAGQDGAGGFFLRFGPEGSSFAGKLFITAATNQTLYVLTPDGTCRPFASIDIQRWGYPTGLTFTPDGKTLLMGTAQPKTNDPAGPPKRGAGKIVRVSPEGVVADEPFVTGLDQPCGILFAPEGFGAYGGQLIVADSGDFNSPVPMTQPVKRDGRLFRVTPAGELALIASGLANPTGVAFLDNQLIVSDINGDFHVGQRELPDGFLVAIGGR